ncbi:MAG: NADH-quinone oxidoreductase subunit K [Candidatus Geothermincolia bacterium]
MSNNGFLLNLNYAAAVLLLVLGLYAVIARRDPVKKVMGLIIMQSAVFLFLVAMGLVGSGETRVVTPGFRAATLVNPVPHTLVLVGIMLSAGITAVALALVVRMRVVKRDAASKDEYPEDEL